jgi:hypothetical protein
MTPAPGRVRLTADLVSDEQAILIAEALAKKIGVTIKVIGADDSEIIWIAEPKRKLGN